jgi:hypothetical protein
VGPFSCRCPSSVPKMDHAAPRGMRVLAPVEKRVYNEVPRRIFLTPFPQNVV